MSAPKNNLQLRLVGRHPQTQWGRPIRISRTRQHIRARDGQRTHSSDEVWALVDRMMSGDLEATYVIDDVIEEGVKAGKTKFVKISSKAYRHFGREYPAKVVPRAYAAITPGRQIVLFGVKTNLREPRAYLSRYRIGDAAEYDSYNRVYFGKIISISDKRVVIDKGDSRKEKASLSIDQFNTKNWDPNNLANGLKRNAEWSD